LACRGRGPRGGPQAVRIATTDRVACLAQVPTLSEILTDPKRIADLPPRQALTMLAQLATLQAPLLARALASGGLSARDADELLTVNVAAKRLGLSTPWLYRHASRLPFTVRVGRQVRFSARRLEGYIEARANGRLT
jgi:excisionase family DNA binding protein